MNVERKSNISYIVKLKKNNEEIFKQLLFSINSLSFLNKIIINEYKEEIEVYGNKIISLNKTPKKYRMTYEDSLKLIYCLTEQQKYLIKKGYSFYKFELENIIMIDDNFICINDKDICKIKNNKFLLTNPFSKNIFSSPEILKMDIIPNNTINISSFDYTLGLLIYYCFFGEKKDKDYEEKLKTIKYTSLYWFLKKCIKEEPNDRKIFLIK
jgi:hypothetical protein